MFHVRCWAGKERRCGCDVVGHTMCGVWLRCCVACVTCAATSSDVAVAFAAALACRAPAAASPDFFGCLAYRWALHKQVRIPTYALPPPHISSALLLPQILRTLHITSLRSAHTLQFLRWARAHAPTSSVCFLRLLPLSASSASSPPLFMGKTAFCLFLALHMTLYFLLQVAGMQRPSVRVPTAVVRHHTM